jgi:hypothetical protein
MTKILVITVSAVGAPAAEEQYVQPIDYVQSVRNLAKYMGGLPKAMITNENWGSATINGLLQSVILDIPVLDAPCNGRAHPTGVMGSMGLNNQASYTSIQTAVGDQPDTEKRISQVIDGSINASSKVIRNAAVEAGGLVAVARNPVPVSYRRENAAIGAISQALEIGHYV